MRIIFLFNHLQISDGVARTLVELANLLSRNGHDICIRPLYICESQAQNALLPHINVSPVFGFYFHGLPKLVKLFSPKILYRFIVRGSYDIEVAYQFGIATKIIGSSSNKKTYRLCWMHTYDEKLSLLKFYRNMDKIICVSKANSIRLKNELNDSVKIDWRYNLIDDEKIVSEGREKISVKQSTHPIFVSVGRHSKEKGYDRLLDCVAKLKNDGYHFQLWLVGDGPEHQLLLRKAELLQLEDIVTLIGSTRNPHKFTAKADMFICSSYREGYSTACLESLILGIPLLTTNVSGAKEMIDEAQCGMIVGLDDESLLRGMRFILDNPHIIGKYKLTLQKTRSRFLLAEKAKRMIGLFDEIQETIDK